MSDLPTINIPTGGQPPAAPAPVVEPPVAPVAPPEPVLSQYAQDVLKDVPDAEREVVSKYISQWDAGISRRVNEVERTYGPLVDLVNQGYDVEDLMTSAQLFDALSNPDTQAAAMEAIQKAYAPQPGQPVPPVGDQGGAPVVQLPPAVVEQMARSNQFMEQMAMREQERAQQQEVEAESKALDEYLGFLKQEKGDFDDNYVLTRMSMGVDGASAVDEFNGMIQQRVQSQGGGTRLPAPPVLTGGSALTGAKPVHQASAEERRAAVAAIVQQANAQAS